MSLQQLILKLVEKIRDPSDRIYIASTINYIRDVYTTGKMGYEELKMELENIVRDIIAMSEPELTEEEIRERAREYADKLARAIQIETLSRRIRTTFRIRF